MSDGISREEFERLLQRVDELEARLEDEREADDSSGGGSVLVDRRDAAVMDCLGHGTTINVNQLEALYRSKTDVRNSSTIKNRIRSLTERDEFEYLQPGTWRFVGGRDD